MAFTQREILEEFALATRPRRPRREPYCHLGLLSVRQINYEAEIHAVESHRVATRAQIVPNLVFWTTIEAEAQLRNFRVRDRRRARAALPSPPIASQWVTEMQPYTLPNADFWKRIEDDARRVSPRPSRARR